MTILTSSTTRDLVFWLVWLSVVAMMLLPQAGIVQVPAVEIWQSAYDPLSWLGPGLRIRWYTAWRLVRQWLKRWERWLVLAGRLWSCRNLAQVLQVLTRRQIVRYLGALPVLVVLL